MARRYVAYVEPNHHSKTESTTPLDISGGTPGAAITDSSENKTCPSDGTILDVLEDNT
jgi:hypothetical protein